MNLTICDLREDCVAALNDAFHGVADVMVLNKDLTRVRADAWAAAGNSFGDMGGGVDRAIDQHFDGKAQIAVQQMIRDDYCGELPVGSAVVAKPTASEPALIYAPTMRIPGRLGPSVNAYLAMRAILLAAIRHGFASIACPMLGSGVGGLAAPDAAEQMWQAHRQIVQGKWREVLHPLLAPYAAR
jgi:O-acetyl-ADP-ribose deacetylase (regulator of RNase III)